MGIGSVSTLLFMIYAELLFLELNSSVCLTVTEQNSLLSDSELDSNYHQVSSNAPLAP